MKVLVADDRPTTRFVLKKKLKEWGYDVVEAADGGNAWRILNEDDPPRIAILDWIMPGLDGVAICRKLQERENGSFVYTILLTSKSQKEDLIYALENGAHNFQSKPISPEELRGHVNVGRHLVEADDQLNEYATQMERLAEERAGQLVHADRLATLGVLAAGLTHEIGTPLTYVMGHAKMLEYQWADLVPFFNREGVSDKEHEKYEKTLESIPEKITAILEGAERIGAIVKGMKTFSRKDTGMRIPADIRVCVENALQLCQNMIKYSVSVEKSFSDDIPKVVMNAQQIEQVLVNLISNAADAMETVGKGVLKITAESAERHVRVTVEDTGTGIPADKLNGIWEPFYTTKREEKGTGLGLSISRGIIEDHGGKIMSENREEGGARFVIELPLKIKSGK